MERSRPSPPIAARAAVSDLRPASATPPPRALDLPPPGRPRWINPADSPLDLLYLSWGLRRFGGHPVRVLRHHGWVYALVLRGTPTLRRPSEALVLRPGQLAIIHPDCASGWTDLGKGVCEVINWMWRTPPRCGNHAPAKGECRVLSVGPGLLAELRHLHLQCRRQVERPDALTPFELERLRLQIDLAVARSHKPRSTARQPGIRLELARRWLAQNMGVADAIRALADYLQVAPTTLNRLFRSQLGMSAADYHRRLRMDQARAWLEAGTLTVKEISYELGYRFPNDFSRAYKRHTGDNPGRTLSRRGQG